MTNELLDDVMTPDRPDSRPGIVLRASASHREQLQEWPLTIDLPRGGPQEYAE